MARTIVFIHGAWVSVTCWDKFVGFFEGKGYKCIAPAWPYKDQHAAQLRKNPPAGLAGLGIKEIVGHYSGIIKGLEERPILIGHSFGGLFVQMLLDQGLGAAGVAIDSAPPKGVFPFYWTSLRSNIAVFGKLGSWKKTVRISLKNFQYAFVNTLPEAEQRAAYEIYVVPETGRIFYQAGLAMFNNITRVNFKNDKRGPLLLTAGTADRICTVAQVKSNYRKYKGSRAVTNYKEFEGRGHWIIAERGWEEVAGYIADWVERK